MNKPVVVIDISSDEEEKILHAKVRKENTPMKDENKKTKNKNNNGSEEEDDDCVILYYDPFESIDVSNKLSIKENEKNVDDDDDVCIVAEKGQVAIRDYPHSRHLCVKLPFDTTPHHDYCGQCYCYVCDAAAPCKFWLNTLGGHCHATENCANWVSMREAARPAPAHDKTTLPSTLP